MEEFRCRTGDNIEEGDVIGIEGETGNSTGIHLHLEIREPDYTPSKHIDVAKYLGIKNAKGDVVVLDKELTREEKIQLIQKNIGWESRTTNYLFNDYKYGEEALEKLLNIDLPNELLDPVVEGIKAKLTVDTVQDVLGDASKLLEIRA